MMRSKVALVFIAVLILAGVLIATGATAPAANAQEGVLGYDFGQAVRVLFDPAVPSAAVPDAAAAPLARVSSASSAQVMTQTLQAAPDPESQIAEAVYEKVNPSVVQVLNLSRSRGFQGQNLGATPQGEGSGFVWDTQGHIVTNDHVVEGADQLQAVFADGTQVDATLVGTDPNSDLAVIQVDPSNVSGSLVPVETGDMSQVQVGELALAIGNPFGYQGTITRGIVSALGRTIPSQTQYQIPEAIQTDAAINPGNSGGPLLNSMGQVIGVNDQIQSSSGSNSGVGFAIPISIVNRVVPSLIQNGSYQHAYLGIAGQTYSKAWAQALGFPANAKGAYVSDVTSGGPADKAGIHGGTQDTSVLLGVDENGPTYLQSGGDLITAVDGQPITKMDDLLIYLEERTSPGQTVTLTLLRSGGQQQQVQVKLGARPTQTTSFLVDPTNATA